MLYIYSSELYPLVNKEKIVLWVWIYIYYNCLSGGLVYVLADVTSSPFSMFIHLTSTALSLVCKTSKGCKQRGQMSLYYVGSSQAEPLCGSLRSLKRNIIWNWPCLYTKCLWHCFKVFNMNSYLRLCAFKRLHCLKSISQKKKIISRVHQHFLFKRLNEIWLLELQIIFVRLLGICT